MSFWTFEELKDLEDLSETPTRTTILKREFQSFLLDKSGRVSY